MGEPRHRRTVRRTARADTGSAPTRGETIQDLPLHRGESVVGCVVRVFGPEKRIGLDVRPQTIGMAVAADDDIVERSLPQSTLESGPTRCMYLPNVRVRCDPLVCLNDAG